MSAKLNIPEKGLFGLPSSVRQTNNEEDSSTQVLDNLDTIDFSTPSTEDVKYSDTLVVDDSNTQVPKSLDTQESENPSTQVLSNLDTKVLENSSTLVPKNLDTEIPSNHSIEVLTNQNTQVLENQSIQTPENVGTGQLEVQDTPVAKRPSAKDSGDQSSWTLPKPRKNNRVKDEKKPARKQASVHLSGAALKALHLFAFEEGLEKSEVVEKALRKFIPKKFFQ